MSSIPTASVPSAVQALGTMPPSILEAGHGVVAEAHPAVELRQLAEHSGSIIADARGFQVIGVGVAGRDAHIRQSIGGIPREPMDVSVIKIVIAGHDGAIVVDRGRVSLLVGASRKPEGGERPAGDFENITFRLVGRSGPARSASFHLRKRRWRSSVVGGRIVRRGGNQRLDAVHPVSCVLD